MSSVDKSFLSSFNQGKVTEFRYSLKLFQELNDTNPFGIAAYVQSFSIRQSLIRYSMGMEIQFIDGAGLVDSGKLQVGNIIELTLFKGEDDAEKLIKNFYITNIEDSIQTTRPNERVFTIKAYTFPAVTDVFPLLRKMDEDTPTNMIKKIVRDRFIRKDEKIGSGEDWVDSNSSVIGGLFFHQISPSDAIKQLLERIPEPETFFFYEDYQGFKLKTFKSMLKSSEGKEYKYIFYPTNQSTQAKEDYYRILYLSQYTHSDYFMLMKSGAIRGELVMIDLVNKKVESRKQLSFLDEKEDILVLGKNEPIKIEQRIFGDSVQFKPEGFAYDYTPASKIAFSENAWGRRDFLDQSFLKRRAQKAFMDQTQITIEVYGNHTIKPGDVVDILVPEQSAYASQDTTTRRQTGKFIVGAVKHNISGTIFQTYLDLYKDGYDTPVTEPAKK